MATLTRAWVVATVVLGQAACSDLVGLNAAPTPFASLQVVVRGDRAALGIPEDTTLLVGLFWGIPRQPDPFCLLPAESEAAAAVIEAGCPGDSLAFLPGTPPAAATTLDATGTAVLDLMSLPEVDTMVGDLRGRIAYGSVFVLTGGGTAGEAGYLGASFLSMSQPDQRLAFREGEFDAQSDFYPRLGCPPPPQGFSVLSAGGFSPEAAGAAMLTGTLPEQDPSSCAEASPDQTLITITLQPPLPWVELYCGQRGGPHFDPPPPISPIKGGRAWACVGLEGSGPPLQLVVAEPPNGYPRCPAIAHHLLRGCFDDPSCADPEWDRTATPPAWWPCPVTP